MSPAPSGFAYQIRDSGEVRITRGGRPAATLCGAVAARFLVDVAAGDPQQVMARITGNYKRGNERAGGDHPRNRRS